ncbi:hypothetical protein NDI39_14730 [Microcoleus sp. ZQ-A2]|nr:hypothetical protein [Microcoleus sp. FACHB-1]
MNKILFQLVTTSLGLFVIFSPLSGMAQTTQPAQNSPNILPPVNCQEERDSDVQFSVFQLQGKTRQYANSKNQEKAAQTLTQLFRNLRRLENASNKAAILEEILDLEIRSQHSRLLADTVDLYIAAGQKQQAVPVLAEALQTVQTLSSGRSYAKTKSLAAIALQYAAIGQTEEALKILDQSVQTEKSIQGAEFKTKALTAIAQAYLAAGKFEQASGILDQSLRHATTVQHPNPYRQGELLAAVASTYAKARQHNQALKVAQLITKAPYHKANAIAAVSRQYSQQTESESALRTAQTIENHKDTADIKAKLLADIGNQYIQTGKPDKAAQVFAQAVQAVQIVDNTEEQSRLLSEVIVKYAQAGQPDAALQLIPKITTPGYSKARAIAAIASSYTKAGQQAKASQALSQTLATIAAIPDANQKSNARADIISSLIEAKRFDFAAQIAQAIEDEFTRADTLREIALQAADAGQTDSALQIIQSLETKFVDHRSRVLHRVALAHTKAGQYDKALQVAQTLDNRTAYRAKTLGAIATQSHKGGQSQRASAIFAQALQAANAAEDTNSKIDALGAVALEYANSQQLKPASQTVSQALQVAQTLEDASLQSSALRETVERFVLAQHYDLALQVAQAMKAPHERSPSLHGIFQQSIEAGEHAKAYQFINLLQTPEEKARWLVAIARQYVQAGNTTQASQILAQALQVTLTIKGPESKTLVFGMPPDITVVDDDSDRGSFLEAISLEYAKAGQHAQAQQVAQRLENQALRTRLNQRLACYQRQ